MNARGYQQQAARTLIDGPDVPLTPQETMIVWNAIGVAGEAGEIADLVKKGIFHRHGLDVAKVGEEIGDLCWYLAALCTKLDLDLGVLMQANIDKLKARYPDGYSSAASQARVDTKPIVDNFDWSLCEPGDMATCSMCGKPIVYTGQFWEHAGPLKPRHPGTPDMSTSFRPIKLERRYPDDAVTRASVRSPMPGDVAICLHCNDQIVFNQYAQWRHHEKVRDEDHTADPIPF